MQNFSGLLIVEDDPDLSGILSTLGKECGFKPFVATSLKSIHSILKLVQFRVAFVDWNLKGFNGQDAVWAIREHSQHYFPEIILISGELEIRRFAQELHVQGFLKKPFDLKDVLDVLNAIRK